MYIILSPSNVSVAPDGSFPTLQASVSGDVLTLNGEAFDFSSLEDGDVLPLGTVNSDWINGDITRVEGVVHVILKSPYMGDGTHAQCYPDPVTVTDGPVPFPSAD